MEFYKVFGFIDGTPKRIEVKARNMKKAIDAVLTAYPTIVLQSVSVEIEQERITDNT